MDVHPSVNMVFGLKKSQINFQWKSAKQFSLYSIQNKFWSLNWILFSSSRRVQPRLLLAQQGLRERLSSRFHRRHPLHFPPQQRGDVCPPSRLHVLRPHLPHLQRHGPSELPLLPSSQPPGHRQRHLSAPEPHPAWVSGRRAVPDARWWLICQTASRARLSLACDRGRVRLCLHRGYVCGRVRLPADAHA